MEETALSFDRLARSDAVSLRELVLHFPDFFYFKIEDVDASTNPALWNEIHPIRPAELAAYTNLEKAGGIAIDRQIRDLTGVERLPNIAEVTMWWMAEMQKHGGQHGIRSCRTPSSTPLGDGRVLCVGFLVNEYLWIRPNVDTDREVVYPS
jgi:hypothetical protein